VTGFNTIALVTVSVAAVGSVAAYALVGGATSCAQAARRQLRRSRSPALPEPDPVPGSAGAGAGVGVADGVRLDHRRLDHG
jgi:hypothetical protein